MRGPHRSWKWFWGHLLLILSVLGKVKKRLYVHNEPSFLAHEFLAHENPDQVIPLPGTGDSSASEPQWVRFYSYNPVAASPLPQHPCHSLYVKTSSRLASDEKATKSKCQPKLQIHPLIDSSVYGEPSQIQSPAGIHLWRLHPSFRAPSLLHPQMEGREVHLITSFLIST